MKLKSLIMFSAAALAFAACSNDENVSTQPTEGTTTVSVKLNMPRIINDMTRSGSGIEAAAETEGTTGETTPVRVTSAKIVLNAVQGGGNQEITLAADELDVMTKTGITFSNVIAPRSIEVYINGDENTPNIKTNLTIDQANTAGLAVPLYKEVTTADTNASDGNGFVWNAEEERYDAIVTLEPRYARLEVSEITHDTNHSGNLCIFKAATFKGLYLNNVITAENGSATANATGAKAWDALSTAAYASPTWSPDEGVYVGETPQAQWPLTVGDCYPYSLFEGVPPTLVFCVNNVTLNDTYYINGWGGTAADYLYAIVSTYKLSTPLTGEENAALRAKYGVADDGVTINTFKKGNIYQITDIAIPDNAWNPEPVKPTGYTVEATVKVLPWTIVEGTVEW